MVAQGLKVVFTGPAYDANGTAILRDDLKDAVRKLGMIVHDNFSVTSNVVVASRADTAKARKALEKGVPVLTYPDFLKAFQVDVTPSKSRKPDPWVDTHRPVGPHASLIGGNEL